MLLNLTKSSKSHRILTKSSFPAFSPSVKGGIPMQTSSTSVTLNRAVRPDEMARDEARHGKAFKGLLERYFGK